jgi:hypothetical protein
MKNVVGNLEYFSLPSQLSVSEKLKQVITSNYYNTRYVS